MKFFKNLFGKKQKEPLDDDFSEEEYERDYEQKKKGLEDILGPMHEMVGHAIFPLCNNNSGHRKKILNIVIFNRSKSPS